jgi:hypothetical protein
MKVWDTNFGSTDLKHIRSVLKMGTSALLLQVCGITIYLEKGETQRVLSFLLVCSTRD